MVRPRIAGEPSMRVEFYGLVFETPKVTFHLTTPWRGTALEHKLFDAIRNLPRVQAEEGADEWRADVTEPKTWRAALQAVSRVMKGWQEDAGPGGERRAWRWLFEGDTDEHGYDYQGEPVSIWAFLRVSMDRGSPGEGEKFEDIDLEWFGLRIWPES